MVYLSGCKSIPSETTMESTSYAVGMAASYVINKSNVDDISKNAILEIIKDVSDKLPSADRTFKDTWLDISNKTTAKWLETKKISTKQSEIINNAFNVLGGSIDYLITKRYPDVKLYENLVRVAIKGFTNGFITTFKTGVPVDKQNTEFLMATKAIQ
jgi:hypothetical protein